MGVNYIGNTRKQIIIKTGPVVGGRGASTERYVGLKNEEEMSLEKYEDVKANWKYK